jgi:hypothetical protein
MNTNAMHNILNVGIWAIGGITAIAMATGCTDVNPGTEVVLECSKSFVPAQYTVPLIAGLGFIKTVINLGRDGFGGLWKKQPPVADDVVTIVQPVKTVAPGSTVVVKTAATTTAKK